MLLEYALGNDSSYMFAVTRASVSLFKLPPRADVDKLATDFRAQLIPPKLQRRIVGIDIADDQQRGLGSFRVHRKIYPRSSPRRMHSTKQLSNRPLR